jgi:hypothetical protein
MKDIAAIISTWDNLEARIKALEWAMATFLAPKLASAIETLRFECCFDDAPETAKRTWAMLEATSSLRDTVDVLLHLRALGATVEHFVEIYDGEGGGSVQKTLTLLNPRKKPAAPSVLPKDWRN